MESLNAKDKNRYLLYNVNKNESSFSDNFPSIPEGYLLSGIDRSSPRTWLAEGLDNRYSSIRIGFSKNNDISDELVVIFEDRDDKGRQASGLYSIERRVWG